jgi:hypothetical protein
VDHSDTDRLELLDRIADRVPELDLDQNEVAWMTLDDGHEALLVNGGGVDGATAPSSSTAATTCTRSDRWHR